MSHRENFGFTVAEAASVGLPIYISTGVDIHPYFESASRQMIFTLEKDYEIDDVISTLDEISDDDLCALGNYSRSVVDRNFSYQSFSQRLRNILDVHNGLTLD
jgi:glycosyltransferase involved in cell wall biosynthesis